MPVPPASLDVIADFLSQKRIALVGLSRDPRHFSVSLFREMVRRGYDMVPVNPKTQNLFGHRCFPRLQDIQPPVDAALLMTTPEMTDAVVPDAIAAGIPRIWMYRAGGQGAVSAAAVALCVKNGIQVVPGQCPYMFWSDAGLGHRLHGLIRKITGRYPQHVASS